MLAWFRLVGWAIFDGLFFYFMRRPRVMRVFAGVFRRHRPVFAPHGAFFAGATFLLTRADDSREVLGGRTIFCLARSTSARFWPAISSSRSIRSDAPR